MKTLPDAKQVADSIKRAADETLALIKQRRAEMEASPMAGSALYVLAGEMHSNIPHILHHLLVIDALAQTDERVLVGYEHQYNVVTAILYGQDERCYSDTADKILVEDKSGALSLSTIFTRGLRTKGVYSSDLLSKRVLEGIKEGDLTSCFVDVAMYQSILATMETDYDDPKVETVINALAIDIDDDDFSRVDDINIRNRFMTDWLVAKAEEIDATLIYHMTGLVHLRGGIMGVPLNISMAQELAAQGKQTLLRPLLCDLYKEVVTEEKIWDVDNAYPVDYMPEISADIAAKDDLDVNIHSKAEEAEYVRTILKTMGREDLIATPLDMVLAKLGALQDLKPYNERWLKMSEALKPS